MSDFPTAPATGTQVPQCPDIERCLLSTVLQIPDTTHEIFEKLDAADFYVAVHRSIYEAAQRLYTAGKSCELVLVAEEMNRAEGGAEPGNGAYLSEVCLCASNPNPNHYIQEIQAKALLRRLITKAGEISAKAFCPGTDAEEALREARGAMVDIDPASERKRGAKPVSALLSKTFEVMEGWIQGKVSGTPTGFYKLDDRLTGLHDGDLTVLAARPSMGKTSLAISILLNVAKYYALNDIDKIVVFLSLEMDEDSITQRMLCSIAEVSFQEMRKGRLPKDDYEQLGKAASVLQDLPIYIDDRPALTPIDLRTRLRALNHKKPIGFWVLDYLQLMKGSTGGRNRVTDVGEFSKTGKEMAKDIRCPGMMLSQLSRAVEQRPDKRPILSDLRESGDIEQDADNVVFIYRPEYYDEDNPELDGVAIVNVAKQRNGPIGAQRLEFKKEYMKFANAKYGPTTPSAEYIHD